MKYIVYITTNLKNGKIYVGVHKTKTPYEFDGYIGNGVYVPKKESFKVKPAETPFRKAVNKYGHKNFFRITLAIFDDAESAYELEEKIVTKEFIKSKISYNIKEGGLHAPTTNKEVFEYDIDGKFIRGWSSLTEAANAKDITPATIIDSITERSITAGGSVWRYTKHETVNVRKRIPSNKGQVNSKAVVQYSKAGYRKKTFKSIADAARATSIAAPSIAAVCKAYATHKSAGNYQWRFATEAPESLPPLDTKTMQKPVLRVSDKGEIIEYDSSGKAAKALGSKKFARSIRKACISGKQYKGFFWKFKVEDMVYPG